MQTRTIEGENVVWHFQMGEEDEYLDEFIVCDEYCDTTITEAKITVPINHVIEAYMALLNYKNLSSVTTSVSESFGDDDDINIFHSKVEFYLGRQKGTFAAVYRAFENHSDVEFNLDLNVKGLLAELLIDEPVGELG